MIKRICFTALIGAAAVLALPGMALAVDGQVLITQARAMAGGVTAGDAPGFPVTISEPGSYRLASNLIVPAGANGIEITANDVTIDLNGFSIVLPEATTQTSPPFFNGITDLGTARKFITIRDGTIIGPDPAKAIDLSATRYATVWGTKTNTLNVTFNTSGLGILVNTESLLRNNVSDGLIFITCPGLITHNVSSGNINRDITAGECVHNNNRGLNLIE